MADDRDRRARELRRERTNFGTGNWVNEPAFQDARRRPEGRTDREERGGRYEIGSRQEGRNRKHGDRERARSYDKEDQLRYSREGLRARDPMHGYDSERDRDWFYANRGWTRSAAEPRDREWTYYRGQDYMPGRNEPEDLGPEIDFQGGYDQKNYFEEGDFSRGIEHWREDERREARPWNPQRERQGSDFERSRNQADYERDLRHGGDWERSQARRRGGQGRRMDWEAEQGQDWRSGQDMGYNQGQDMRRDERDRGYGYDRDRDFNPRDYAGDEERYGIYEQRGGRSHFPGGERDRWQDQNRDFERGERPREEGPRGYFRGRERNLMQDLERDEQRYGRSLEQERGPYTGMGPQGYQRKDDRIQDEVCEILSQHGQLDASGIEIEVQNGEVTLRGEVDRKREKNLAEDLAERVSGVKDVHNLLRISPNDGARVRGMGRENVVQIGRIQEGMRVMGSDGQYIGQVSQMREQGFAVRDDSGRETFITYDMVERTNGSIFLRIASHHLENRDWQRR